MVLTAYPTGTTTPCNSQETESTFTERETEADKESIEIASS